MQDKKQLEVEILLGRLKQDEESWRRNYHTYGSLWDMPKVPGPWALSLNVNRKQEFGIKADGGDYRVNSPDPHTLRNSYLDFCAKYAKVCGAIMKDLGVSDYFIVNGERIRVSNSERVKCLSMPEDGVRIFKETLETILQKDTAEIEFDDDFSEKLFRGYCKNRN